MKAKISQQAPLGLDMLWIGLLLRLVLFGQAALERCNNVGSYNKQDKDTRR